MKARPTFCAKDFSDSAVLDSNIDPMQEVNNTKSAPLWMDGMRGLPPLGKSSDQRGMISFPKIERSPRLIG